MNAVRHIGSWAVLLASLSALAQVRIAAQGEATTGEIVSETPQEIRVNVRPCDGTAVVVVFRQPYTKDPAGTIVCGAVTKPLVQVIQR